MADLKLIQELNRKYKKKSSLENVNLKEFVVEAFDREKVEGNKDDLKKGFNSPDFLTNLGVNYALYFDKGLSVNAALMYVDVCDFSTRQEQALGKEIAEYFHNYYDKVLPIIYKYGGEGEKIIGDGIICVFAPPFSDDNFEKNLESANVCAQEIIKETKGSEFSSKVALHDGIINYFQTKTNNYQDYTMIGKPLTELFRLESVSENESVNFYEGTKVYDLYSEQVQRAFYQRISGLTNFLYPISEKSVNLKGTDHSKVYSWTTKTIN